MTDPLRFYRYFSLIVLCLFIVVCRADAAGKPAVLSEKEIRAAVEQFVNSKVEGRGWETRIIQCSCPEGIKLSAGRTDLELVAPGHWDGWGSVSLALIVRVNGQVEKNLSVRINVLAETEMLVASRQIPSGTVLASDDLILKKQDIGLAKGNHLQLMTDAIGKKTRMVIRAGSPVRSDQLVKVPVIKTGQLVTIIAENRMLRITVSGRAKGSGGIGDVIVVQNLTSHKDIPARIVDAGTVSVAF